MKVFLILEKLKWMRVILEQDVFVAEEDVEQVVRQLSLVLRERDGKVYTQVIRNCSREEILPLISTKISKDSVLFTDGFKTYDGLVDMGYKKHYRVHHGKNEFSKKQGNVRNHINGIENFWGLAKVGLSKFRGMNKNTFYLHLKECEFRV